MDNHKHPVFCFRYLHSDFDFSQCDKNELSAFLNQLSKLSKMSWQDIEFSPRHGLGTEKIDRTSIKVPVPSFITEDVSFLLAFRFQGKKPFIAYRNKFICHVIYIDPKFKVYSH